ncbi:hypothetical protein GCM10019059_16840 [Camelimonas fluminis]|uniref:DUF1269 domain-containing protein n=1 Tax=Camelimonas fluminis TaxID=1576911 RepID=A0ABV7UJN4_9HYPH|nr:hypothetical protein [Camelimonas fluminis]GHE58177.1 hypothetical protein GCM10019059_16840 [Camelimonas fluminis]
MTTVTALFDTHEHAMVAAEQLQALGVAPADISILANNADAWYPGSTIDQEVVGGILTGAGTGAALGGAGGLLAGLGLLTIPGIGPVVAAGWLAATGLGALAGAAAGGAAGGVVGAMVGAGLTESEAHLYAEGVRRGGSIVSARVAEAKAAHVASALQQAGAADLTQREASWRDEGWMRFDPDADAWRDSKLAKERERLDRARDKAPS